MVQQRGFAVSRLDLLWCRICFEGEYSIRIDFSWWFGIKEVFCVGERHDVWVYESSLLVQNASSVGDAFGRRGVEAAPELDP